MTYSNNRPSHKGPRHDDSPKTIDAALLEKINFEIPDVTLFDTTAESCAKQVSDCKPEVNKSTQLRRFYDEVCAWHDKVQQNPENFDKHLPLIRMINAKVAYAEGRNLVDKKFSGLMQDCLRKVKNVHTFNNFKTFFEAFLGFYKIHKPK